MNDIRIKVRQYLSQIVDQELPVIVAAAVDRVMGESRSPSSRIQTPAGTKKFVRNGRPRAASRNGVEVGQTWKAKSYHKSAGRVIRIESLEKTKAVPALVSVTRGKKIHRAKRIAYATLVKNYELVSSVKKKATSTVAG